VAHTHLFETMTVAGENAREFKLDVSIANLGRASPGVLFIYIYIYTAYTRTNIYIYIYHNNIMIYIIIITKRAHDIRPFSQRLRIPILLPI